METNLKVKQVYWSDKYFNMFTSFVVCGLVYTFPGEIEDIEGIVGEILYNIEHYEEDGATTEMSDAFHTMVYENEIITNVILN